MLGYAEDRISYSLKHREYGEIATWTGDNPGDYELNHQLDLDEIDS